jgi:hypothetical protein
VAECCENLYSQCESVPVRDGNRIVVVSGHLDDAVLSLGSTVTHAVQAGAKVEILTVFSDSPASQAQAGPLSTGRPVRKAPTDADFSPTLMRSATLPWRYVRTRRAHRRTKYRAARSYRSQLYHLGLGRFGLHRMLWREAVQGGEPIAWLS